MTLGIALLSNRRPWTVPVLSTPVQCDRSIDLMLNRYLAIMAGPSACHTKSLSQLLL